MARDVGINTYGYIWSVPAAACVRHLGKRGYRQIEFLLQPPHLSFDDFGPEMRVSCGRPCRTSARSRRRSTCRASTITLPARSVAPGMRR